MTGYVDDNRCAFNHAANFQKSLGRIVLNPALLPDGLSQAEYMSICLPMLMCCDTIYMLQGWELSAGANAELALAKKLNLTVVLQCD